MKNALTTVNTSTAIKKGNVSDGLTSPNKTNNTITPEDQYIRNVKAKCSGGLQFCLDAKTVKTIKLIKKPETI
ncbi:hypothetical protein KUL49_07310 [Alteromonas sp. KUL49]|nr:hypothetical protein KUL49_07310 [Alteromonas sp. KUL49]